MAGSSSHSFNKTHLQDPNLTSFSSSMPPKSPKSKFPLTHYVFSKSLMVILVLLVFLFFPSKVPEVFRQTTIITKIWELIYLLVIGIAVSYGLFSRKMGTVHSINEFSQFDDNNGAKEPYLTGISHISSIFEDGFRNSYGFGEKEVLEECKGSYGFPEFGNEFGNSDGKKLNRYFLGESVVVIDDENFVLEQLSKPKSSKQSSPLCLPVRSLGSKSSDSATVKSGNRGGCSSVLSDSSSGGDGMRNGKFRGLVPIKLEEKFKEADSDSPTPLNWRSKSMRLRKREELCSTDLDETSHFRPLSRPLSVGVFDLEGPKSQSMRCSMPSQTKNSAGEKELRGKETNQGYQQPSPKGDAPFINSKPQRFSVGTSSGVNTQVSSKETLNDFGKTRVEDGALDPSNDASFVKSKHQRSSICAPSEVNVLGKEEKALDSSNPNLQPAPIASTYKRGKSVRTNRPSARALEAKVKIFPSQTDEKVEKGPRFGTNTTNGNLGNANPDEAQSISDDLSDTEPHSGEVDRKADEFIAKFKEQIRLQRAASARRW